MFVLAATSYLFLIFCIKICHNLNLLTPRSLQAIILISVQNHLEYQGSHLSHQRADKE